MIEIVNDRLSSLNRLGNAFSSYASGAFLQSALLVAILFGIDLLLRKRVRGVVRYCLWLLVLVKLILPPTLALPTGIGYWLGDRLPARSGVSERPANAGGFDVAAQHRLERSEPSGGTTLVPPAPSAGEPDVPVAPAASRVTPITWQGLVLLFWLAGMLAFAALLVQRVRFVKGLVATSVPAGGELLRVLDQCCRQMGVRRQVGLRTSEAVPSPAVCGLLRPIVLMPTSLVEKLSPEGLKAALIHELAHIKRGDLWINSLQTLLQVIHFYNPFVWFANAMIRRTCEEAVDETVLVTLGGEAKDYGNTLIDIGEMAFWKADFGLRLVGVAESRKALKRRIKHMLTRPVPKNARIGTLGTIAILVVAAVLLPMARAAKSNNDAHATPQVTGAGAAEKVPPTGESGVFVDPKTGITFRKVKGFVGPNDVVEEVLNWDLRASPNGKFLLAGSTIIPLGGGKPFKVLDQPSGPIEGYWSPDGKKIAFCGGHIWVVRLDPNTAHPTEPAKKLFEGQLWVRRWLADSERILVNRHENQPGELVRAGPTADSVWTVSANDGTLTQITDFSSVGIPSPDGESAAYEDTTIGGGERTWVKSAKGGPPREIDDEGTPDTWSPDSKWVHRRGSGTFIRVADGYKVNIDLPAEVGRPLPPSSLRVRKMYSYRSSYEYAYPLKVVSVSGGAPCELGIGVKLDPGNHFWWPDSQAIIAEGSRRGYDTNLWALPLNGGEPIPFKTDVPVGGGNHLFSFSPDRKSLLITTYKALDPDTGREVHDVSVVPVSWQEMRTTGPAVLIFKEWHCRNFLDQPYGNVWSPDGKKIALADLGSIHVIPATGGDAVPLVRVPNVIDWLNWSPDGQVIAFHQSNSEAIEVVSSSGGEARVVFQGPLSFDMRGDFCWSPDSKAIIVAARGDKAIRSISAADGSTRSLVNLKDLGLDWVVGLQFSPDGKLLAFGDPDGPLFLLHMESGKVDKLPGRPLHICWSPDGKWLSHIDTPNVKVRTESVLWEMDVEEALAKLAK